MSDTRYERFGSGSPGSERQTREAFIEQIRALAESTEGDIVEKLEQAIAINEELDGNGDQVVDQLEAFRNEVLEQAAAFEARAERLSSPYVLPPNLEKVLQVARLLKKPLLLEGEPGTGKTSLAYGISGDENLPLIHVRGKSTLSAQSVLYEIDNVARLRDVYMSAEVPEDMRQQAEKWADYLQQGGEANNKEFKLFTENLQRKSQFLNLGKVSNIENYIRFGALGEAIIRAARGETVILLFDEMDKSRREFPNDLLDELEHMTIRIQETGLEVSAPRENIIVMITSNHERDLPEAFLRRCVYHYIEFPSPEHMSEIIKSHLPHVKEKLLKSVLDRFYKIRELKTLNKKPSTSEIIEWVQVLIEFGVEEIGDDLPFPEVLLKTKEDHQQIVQSKAEMNSRSGLPDKVTAALRGDMVAVLKGQGYSPVKAVEVFLANKNIPFVSADYRNEDRPFDIQGFGIRKVDELTFAAAKGSEGADVLATLDEIGLLEKVFEVSDDPVEFAEVSDSKESYVVGADTEGRTVYRMRDGKVVYERNAGDVKVGPFGELGLKQAEINALIKAGFASKEELFTKIEDEGDDFLVSIPGIGVRSSASIKQAYKDREDWQPPGFGSTLNKLRNRSLDDDVE